MSLAGTASGFCFACWQVIRCRKALTSTVVDSRDFSAERKRADQKVPMPQGIRIVIIGDADYITGEPDREPLMGPEYLCEYVAGYTAAIAAEAGLRRRSRSGEGMTIDIAAMEAMLPMHQTTFSALAFGSPRQRTGRYYETYPLTARPCRDGHVLICVVTDEEFDRFLIAIGRPDLLADPRFVTKPARFENRDALDAEMAGFLESHDAEHVVEILDANGVTAAKIARADDVRANAQLRHRGFWRDGAMPGNPLPAIQIFGEPGRQRVPSKLARPGASCRPLDGLVVADFTVYWAGPSATCTPCSRASKQWKGASSSFLPSAVKQPYGGRGYPAATAGGPFGTENGAATLLPEDMAFRRARQSYITKLDLSGISQ